MDYKPLVLDHDNNGDPFDSMIAVQTDIQDFEGTIAYQIDTVTKKSYYSQEYLISSFLRTLETVQLFLSTRILLET